MHAHIDVFVSRDENKGIYKYLKNTTRTSTFRVKT